jgi:hypothetical protein
MYVVDKSDANSSGDFDDLSTQVWTSQNIFFFAIKDPARKAAAFVPVN